MEAPERFVAWLSAHEHVDPKWGHVYLYHPRSDAHSIALCQFIVEDLLAHCSALSAQAKQGEVACGINVRFNWPGSRKQKTLDLALGKAATVMSGGLPGISRASSFSDVFVSCEAKSVMTEHGKSQPRVFDELSSSHEIVHRGRMQLPLG